MHALNCAFTRPVRTACDPMCEIVCPCVVGVDEHVQQMCLCMHQRVCAYVCTLCGVQ